MRLCELVQRALLLLLLMRVPLLQTSHTHSLTEAATTLIVSYRILTPWEVGSRNSSNWTRMGAISIRRRAAADAEWASYDEAAFAAATQQLMLQEEQFEAGEKIQNPPASFFPALSLKVEEASSSPRRFPLITTVPLSFLRRQQLHTQEEKQKQHQQQQGQLPCAHAWPQFSLKLYLGNLVRLSGVELLDGSATVHQEQQYLQGQQQQEPRMQLFCFSSKPALLLAQSPKAYQTAVALPAGAGPQPAVPQQHEQEQQQQPSLLQRYWWVIPLIVLVQLLVGSQTSDEERPSFPGAGASGSHASSSSSSARSSRQQGPTRRRG